MRLCIIVGCNKKHKSRSYCAMHYYRYKKYGTPLIKYNNGKPKSLEKKYIKNRFYSKITLPNENGCMNWLGKSLTSAGYGQFSIYGGKSIKAHRYSYKLFIGPIVDGKCVMHSCDNPLCVAPEHLSLGTQNDNIQDAKNKGRMSSPPIAYGKDNKSTKLTEEDVRDIRIMLSQKVSTYKIADIFNISRAAVWSIKNRITWSQVI